MKHGICLLTQIPMRAEPSEKSEMVSQILFGEIFRIDEVRNSWALVFLFEDNYKGWIDAKMITPLSSKGLHRLTENEAVYPSNLFFSELEPTGNIIIAPGSRIPADHQNEVVFFDDFKLHTKEIPLITDTSVSRLIASAENYLNAPYLWGGKTPFGFDCSGYVQIVFKTLGISIPRDSSQQAETGSQVDFISTAIPGDLAFFDNEEGHISHVGIIHSKDRIIHCSGHVKIDKIDQQGIYDSVKKKYTHKLRMIKRIIRDN